MFEWLSKFEKIFVTGPQRSGTRICAKMIAHDTQYEFVDETQINMDSFNSFSSFLESKKNCVLQCPALCRHIHYFASEANAIVLMRRKIGDIIQSQKRIKWNKEWLELIRYDRSKGMISEIKYGFWEKTQKKQIRNAYEIEYDSLKTHPLWIKKKERENFSPMQTEINGLAISYAKNSLIRKSPNVKFFVNAKRTEGIVLNEDKNFHLINKTSLEIWEMCDGRHSIREIVDHLARLFPEMAKGTLAKDTCFFIEDLYKNHFITLLSKKKN